MGCAQAKNAAEGERVLTRESQETMKQFFKGFAGAAASLLLLDYDGTLAPFRVDRFQAVPWVGVRELLNRIQNQKKTRIEVVSGRPAAEIVQLLQLDTPPTVWGLHGAERLNPDGSRELESTPPETQAHLDKVKSKLRGNTFGGLFEAKPNAAVMHWRGASPRKAKEIEKLTRTLFEPLAQIKGLQLLEFECGLELRAGRDKGSAVTTILDELGVDGAAKIPAAFLGDDITDEAGFAAMRGRGLSVLVRRAWRKTNADVWLKPPEELRRFLEMWIEASP